MRKAIVAFAVAATSTFHPANSTEVPVSVSATGSTTVVMVRQFTPSPGEHAAKGLLGSVGREDGSALQAREFRQRPPAPIPMAKPLVWPRSVRSRTAVSLPPDKVCKIIEIAAREHKVPIGFLTRLIWSESRFQPNAVSPAGARGIAQFMPATAVERGLSDPFDPEQSLWAAASLLSGLKQRFGNFGLAAAAYNSGPKRVSDWLHKQRRLPEETRNYVKAITGRTAKSWAVLAKSKAADMVAREMGQSSCVQTAAALREADRARY